MVFSVIPRSFLCVVPLQVGAEIVAACAILNKVSALYGLGALFNGHRLTPMQWVMNLVSAAVVPLTVWGFSSIYHRRPLRCLAFTYYYVLDTFVALGFTVYFIVYWFAVAGKAAHNPPQGAAAVETVRATEIVELMTRGDGASGDALLDKSMTVGQELAMTIVATTLFLLVRFYFMIVLIGYARLLVRRTNLKSYNGQPPGTWVAKLQYYLIRPFETFWTGQQLRRGRARSFGPAETQRLEPDRS